MKVVKEKKCKECGWFIACEKCSEEYDKIDLWLKEKEMEENEKRNK